jgi:hypothetical protein
MRPKYDILWKGMIEEVIEDLLLFVDPEIGRELDLGRGFHFLDKELAEIYPDAEKAANIRVVDKLVRIYLRDGGERWMLLHIEVQGGNDKDFARRMFEYYTRLFSKHGRPVAAIAIFTGRDGNIMPAVFEDRCLWMRARYEYKTLNIADYPDDILRASRNPFAAVLLVAKEVLLRVKGTDKERDKVLLEQKVLMVRLLKKRMREFGKKKTKAIHAFLDNYVAFKKPETNRKFMERRRQILGEKNTMGIIDQLREIKHKEGVEEGHEKGVQEGLEKAIGRLLANTEFSPKKIAELMEVPTALVQKIKKELCAK